MLFKLIMGLVAVALVVAVFHPATRPMLPQPSTLPAATAIGPGVGINVAFADHSGGKSCTTGFLVRTGEGRSGLLTAGHCNGSGGPGTVSINYGRAHSLRNVGTVTESVSQGDDFYDHDIALITLDDKATRKIPVTADVDGRAVSGVSDQIEIGQHLCHIGIRTGGPSCGPVVRLELHKVMFEAPSGCGDSGGPVYTVAGDGTVTAVGIHVAGSNDNDVKPECDATHRFSIAEVIQPWLDKWDLTLVTPDPGTGG